MRYRIMKGPKLMGHLTCDESDIKQNTPGGCTLELATIPQNVSVESGVMRETGRLIDPAQMREMQRQGGMARILQLQQSEQRYIADSAAGELDEEGQRRWDAIRAEMKSIRESGVLRR